MRWHYVWIGFDSCIQSLRYTFAKYPWTSSGDRTTISNGCDTRYMQTTIITRRPAAGRPRRFSTRDRRPPAGASAPFASGSSLRSRDEPESRALSREPLIKRSCSDSGDRAGAEGQLCPAARWCAAGRVDATARRRLLGSVHRRSSLASDLQSHWTGLVHCAGGGGLCDCWFNLTAERG